MTTTNFNTDLFRDITFDLLSGIANDPTKFDEFIQAYLTKLHERNDVDELRKYTKDIYEKILNLQLVHASPGFQLKNSIHEKIVILYFWNFSNVHSAHMMPKFVGIDKRYSTAGLTVLGIHSPKYEHEKQKPNIRHAVERQLVPFNVVNDNGLQVWNHVGCQLWPTVLIIGPDALPLFIFEGENHVQHIETFLLPVFNYYKLSVQAVPNTSTTSHSTPDDSANSNPTTIATKFKYPSYICVTSNGYLCISFSGSNQLVLCELNGKIIDIVGTGHPGLADGDIHQVEFDNPHGLVEFNGCIYVADTNNHSIRVFEPTTRRVLTLIGTGRLGNDNVGGMKRLQQPINSPVGLCITESPFDHKLVLLITMAGLHQVWAYAFEETQWWNDVILQKNSCAAILGSGTEENGNSSDPMTACFASPRGICNGTMKGESVLFIADSDSSTIRVVTLQNGNVSNLVGGDSNPKNLSAFGDLDGKDTNARLQYPTDVAFHYPTSHLYISDTFNNKLKRIDMKNLTCTSYFVTDTDMKKQRGESNSAKFHEPQGLAIIDHYIFIADKNNSYVKRIDLDNGTISRLRFNLGDSLSDERTFGSKHAYLSIILPEIYQLREGTAGTWIIEDQDGFKICDGELTRSMSDQILLDYVPRDKQIAHLKYELIVVYEDEKFTMIPGVVQPVQQTDTTIEFLIKIDPPETNNTY